MRSLLFACTIAASLEIASASIHCLLYKPNGPAEQVHCPHSDFCIFITDIIDDETSYISTCGSHQHLCAICHRHLYP
ncbi:hypothetical protein L596_022445 [Steinernema carpocapsae]|uniref:Secreted protein n=1 Tax=Steinernema carpocapsae TaxID=34508 RepID=A0A4U5MML2_STECR|nr:hypothetical protein L596_022445 [Steinernema carpocapsae]